MRSILLLVGIVCVVEGRLGADLLDRELYETEFDSVSEIEEQPAHSLRGGIVARMRVLSIADEDEETVSAVETNAFLVATADTVEALDEPAGVTPPRSLLGRLAGVGNSCAARATPVLLAGCILIAIVFNALVYAAYVRYQWTEKQVSAVECDRPCCGALPVVPAGTVGAAATGDHHLSSAWPAGEWVIGMELPRETRSKTI